MEYRRFNGWYAVVDDCDNVLFESKNFVEALDFFDDIDNEAWLTKEMELFNSWGVELGFTSFAPVEVNL